MTSELEQRRIIVAVSGGIAAYKAADLVSRLRKQGALVRVAMTASATRFVAPLTFEALSGHPVYQDVFERPTAWEMEHIGWARWGEALIAAPATANLLAKLAHGLADDAVTTLALAFEGPVWIAPAMNTSMWQHPATQANLTLLQARGVRVIAPDAGPLACGEVGAGRMAQPEAIAAQLAEALAPPAGALAGKTVLVTTGPTREALDPIRFISNRSSGRMGVELAREARARGARVMLVHGPLTVALPEGVEAYPVESAREMLAQVQQLWPAVDAAVFAAAVANYESAGRAQQKIKGGERLALELNRTPDIAGWCGAHRQTGQLLIGFAAESENLIESARRKLEQKGMDLVCANRIGLPGMGFAADRNQVAMVRSAGEPAQSPELDKRTLAGWIWDRAVETWPAAGGHEA